MKALIILLILLCLPFSVRAQTTSSDSKLVYYQFDSLVCLVKHNKIVDSLNGVIDSLEKRLSQDVIFKFVDGSDTVSLFTDYLPDIRVYYLDTVGWELECACRGYQFINSTTAIMVYDSTHCWAVPITEKRWLDSGTYQVSTPSLENKEEVK